MNAWYLSYNRFEKRIIRRWEKRGFTWNKSHLNLLPYAYRTVMFWAVQQNTKINAKAVLSPLQGEMSEGQRGAKVSQKNQTVGHPTLF